MPRSRSLSDLVARLLRGDQPPGTPAFDLDALDRAVGAVRGGDVVVVGGHPGAPVDALLLRAALTAARRGKRALVVAPGAHDVAVVAWLLSTTGLPLDVIWERRVPDVVAAELVRAFERLPVTIIDGIGEGVPSIKTVLEASTDVGCVVVLGYRWLDAHTDPRAILFDLKRLARHQGIAMFVGIDTRYPGPRAATMLPRPDHFADSSVVALADVALLLTAPWIYEASSDDHDTFSVAVVAPAERRVVIPALRNPPRTMQIVAPDGDLDP